MLKQYCIFKINQKGAYQSQNTRKYNLVYDKVRGPFLGTIIFNKCHFNVYFYLFI